MNPSLIGDRAALHAALASLSEEDYSSIYSKRMDLFRAEMRTQGVDAAVLTLGADVPWLIGYEPMPLERITALVLRADGDATLVVPNLEAPRVRRRGDLFGVKDWGESQDPFALIGDLGGGSPSVLVSDRGWATWLLELQRLPSFKGSEFVPSSRIALHTRRSKDYVEMTNLALAAAAADEVAALLQSGEIVLRDRSEIEVSREIISKLKEFGHRQVNFSIVGSGENSASPHHEPTERVIRTGDIVVCDFGGTYSVNDEPGYCSDTTRTFSIGEPDPRFLDAYQCLEEAQRRAREAAVVGAGLSSVDAVARDCLEERGLGEYFFHRLGHGIGLEEHEDPYLAPASSGELSDGDAFSIEPGVYFAGQYGARIEDIAVCYEGSSYVLNNSPRSLCIV